MFTIDAVIELVRSFLGVTLTESLLMHPARFKVTLYKVGDAGYTRGVAVFALMISGPGVQLKIPFPDADNCKVSNPQ